MNDTMIIVAFGLCDLILCGIIVLLVGMIQRTRRELERDLKGKIRNIMSRIDSDYLYICERMNDIERLHGIPTDEDEQDLP